MPHEITGDILEVDYKVIGKDMQSYTPHNDFCVEIIQTWSKGGFFMVKDSIYPIETGSVFIINAIENHYSNPDDVNTYARNKLIVSSSYFTSLMQVLGLEETVWKHIEQNGSLHYDLPSNGELANTIDHYFRQAAEICPQDENGNIIDSGDPLLKARIAVCLAHILLLLFSEETTNEVMQNKSQKVLTSITQYINDHTNSWKQLSLEEMSQSLHISRSYISHLFKRTTGQSLMQYVANLRIAEAKKLLVSTDMKVQDISERLNYSNSTIFCKTFKKIVGSTPNEYRSRQRSKG